MDPVCDICARRKVLTLCLRYKSEGKIAACSIKNKLIKPSFVLREKKRNKGQSKGKYALIFQRK